MKSGLPNRRPELQTSSRTVKSRRQRLSWKWLFSRYKGVGLGPDESGGEKRAVRAAPFALWHTHALSGHDLELWHHQPVEKHRLPGEAEPDGLVRVGGEIAAAGR